MNKILKILIIVFIIVQVSLPVCAFPSSDGDAVLSIIGEAENQKYIGMLAVACSIRNRNTLYGVYGRFNSRVKKHLYSQKIYDLALKAWKESEKVDIVDGATHWDNVDSFGVPYWAEDMTETVVINDHHFFKLN